MNLVRSVPVRPVVFLSEDSPASQLMVLRNLYGLHRGRPPAFSPKPGLWFRLDLSSPTWEELVSFADGNVPRRFQNATWKATTDVLVSAAVMELLSHALVEGQRSGLSANAIIAVLGTLSQCWFSTNDSVRQRAIDLAQGKHLVAVATPPVRVPSLDSSPAVPEPVEAIAPAAGVWSGYLEAAHAANRWGQGGLISGDRISVWTATHAGPDAGRGGIELQDAVYVEQFGQTIVFALADGVGASAGAGAAARLGAFAFCRNIVSQAETSGYVAGDLFDEALLYAYKRLKELGEFLITTDRESELSTVAPLLDPRTAAYFVRATLEGLVDRPALCTTLLGGVVKQKDSWFELECLQVGDGIVEVIVSDGQVSALFDMDRSQNALNSALSPVRKLAPDESDCRKIQLPAGSWIVVSSDGLPKGNTQSIWSNLQQLSDDFPPGVASVQARPLAADLLEKAAKAGREDPSGTLFADNLSLILVRLA